MKKTVLTICLLSIVMISCNDTKKAGKAVARKEACKNLDEYDKFDREAKAKWLHDNGRSVCEDILYERTLVEHRIKNPSTVEPASGKPFKIMWKDLKALTSELYYEVYIGFNIDTKSKDIKNLILMPEFNSDRICFSPTLFNAVAKKEAFKDDTMIEFINAKSEKTEKVVMVTDSNLYENVEQISK